MNSKLENYIKTIKHEGQREVEKINRETSELMLRDKHGKLFTVKITIDHDLDPNLSAEELDRLIINREAGKISDIMENGDPINPEIGEVKEFVFSSQAVAGMREAGLELDTVVVSMLRASGKIA
jgi:hypothetical protein